MSYTLTRNGPAAGGWAGAAGEAASGWPDTGAPRRASSPRPKRRSLLIFQYLHAKFDISPRTPRARSVINHRQRVARCLRHCHVTGNHRVVDNLSKEVAD